MRNFLLIASVVLGLGACGKSGGDEVLSKMEDFKGQACACKDKACGEKVMKDMSEYMEKWMESNKDFKPSKEQDEKADKIGDEMRDCIEKLK